MQMLGKVLLVVLCGLAVGGSATMATSGVQADGGVRPSALPEGYGLSAAYPGDVGIANSPAVVLSEDFTGDGVEALKGKWSTVETRNGRPLFLDTDAPLESAAKRSLRIVATRGENEGGFIYKALRPGYDQLYLRFYVKFARDDGFHSHFAYLRGSVDPQPWPMGGAGVRPTDSWAVGVEPSMVSNQTWPFPEFDPPGIWHFYNYWPEMRSWENVDGTGTSFYGNTFEPRQPLFAPKDKWVCVEIMVKMNSSPETADGEQALWIDGKVVIHAGPGTPVGHWVRQFFINDEAGKPFEGFRWRKDMRAQINQVGIESYVSDSCFAATAKYAGAHPGLQINTKASTVWFANVVLAKEYIGPIKPIAR